MPSASVVSYVLSRLDNSGTSPTGARKLAFTWLAADTGAIDTCTISANDAKVLKGLYCVLGTSKPGTVQPTASYDITLVDSQGIDIMGSSMVDRSATAAEQAKPAISTLAGRRLVDSTLTLTIVNNSVDSAVGYCNFYFTK